jgi:hypothetical protein
MAPDTLFMATLVASVDRPPLDRLGRLGLTLWLSARARVLSEFLHSLRLGRHKPAACKTYQYPFAELSDIQETWPSQIEAQCIDDCIAEDLLETELECRTAYAIAQQLSDYLHTRYQLRLMRWSNQALVEQIFYVP